jgi:hypothetical protein
MKHVTQERNHPARGVRPLVDTGFRMSEFWKPKPAPPLATLSTAQLAAMRVLYNAMKHIAHSGLLSSKFTTRLLRHEREVIMQLSAAYGRVLRGATSTN